MTHRVLLVDDSAQWRDYLRAALEPHSRFLIAAEASDGHAAIEHARVLQPDVVLLDVGLPLLNGIEVARRILAADPARRILFISEHRSPEITAAALDTGAYGYVLKSDAGRDLLAGLDAIVCGHRFVSTQLRDLIDLGDGKARPDVDPESSPDVDPK